MVDGTHLALSVSSTQILPKHLSATKKQLLSKKTLILYVHNVITYWKIETPHQTKQKLYFFSRQVITRDFKITFENLIFSKKNLFIWKNSLSRSQTLESEVSKINLRFLKNSWMSKNRPEIAKLFSWFLTTWFELLFQN